MIMYARNNYLPWVWNNNCQTNRMQPWNIKVTVLFKRDFSKVKNADDFIIVKSLSFEKTVWLNNVI